MRREGRNLLEDALDAGRLAVEFSAGLTFEQYLADPLRSAAIERKLFIVGEAISQLRSKDAEVYESLTNAWSIVGFRNLLAHGYNRIDDLQLWRVLTDALPATLLEIRSLLDASDQG